MGTTTAKAFLWAALSMAQLLIGMTLAADRIPFVRTEEREPCANYTATKQPFFGETHLHTAYSFDAVVLDTRNTPEQAYTYAKGGRVGLPPWADTRTQADVSSNQPSLVTEHSYCMPGEHCQFMATRTIQFPEGRALDFAAITDHSEQFGESNICTFEATQSCASDSDCDAEGGQACFIPSGDTSGMCKPKGYNDPICLTARDELSRIRQGAAASIIAGLENVAQNPSRPPELCGAEGAQCTQQAKLVWDKIQAQANSAYDRSSACSFTSLIAYEYTAMAANGRCADADALPCWDQAQDNQVPDKPDSNTPSADCPSGAACIMNFTGSSGADNLHRNVIFRNDQVVDRPISNVESPLGCGAGSACTSAPGWPVASPVVMLQALQSACTENPAKPNCDVLTIPHNPNMSRGSLFIPPDNTPNGLLEAALRQAYEPLVEMTQIKGQSECRYNAKTGMAWTNPPDELCSFENQGWARLGGSAEGYLTDDLQTTETIPPRSYVRNTLENGIAYAAKNGINPFQLGFVGGLDNHNGTPGQSDAGQYAKSGAHGIQSFATSSEALNERFFLGIETNAGGLTVAWAEENSRDAIFTALKNRETYATSGTRPIVRVFGGFGLPTNLCKSGDFAERGYANGVPMGGTLIGPGDGQPPRFAISALKDPGWPGHPGTPLERAQIIKGWVDGSGQTHEQVFDVAGKASSKAPEKQVSLRTCKPIVKANQELCTVWTDPSFDPQQHAFYYARVLETSSCRWTQQYCNARGVNCNKPMGTCRSEKRKFNGRGCNSNEPCGGGVCTLPPSYEEYEYNQCCSGVVPKTVQQRAWTSPIWYQPSAASLSGQVTPTAPSLAGR